MKRVAYIISAIVVVAIIVVVLMYNRKSAQDKTLLASMPSSAVNAGIDAVKDTSFNMSFSSNGLLEPVHELSFMSDVAGRVVRVYAEEGTTVQKGKVLLQVDDEILKADYQASQSAYNSLKKDYERFRNANSGGGVSDQQLDNIRTQLASAESRYIVSKRRLADATVKAPISGIINKSYVEVGAYLNPGIRLFDIVDNSQLHAWCTVTERQALLVRKGQRVRIACDAFPGEAYEGKVNFVGEKADRSLTYPVEISIGNKNKRQLRSGMYVTVYFDMTSERKSIFIPRSAIVGGVKTASVYVVKNSVAEKRDVAVGDIKGNKVEIVNGLQAGDSIVVSGLINISEGSKVKNKE